MTEIYSLQATSCPNHEAAYNQSADMDVHSNKAVHAVVTTRPPMRVEIIMKKKGAEPLQSSRPDHKRSFPCIERSPLRGSYMELKFRIDRVCGYQLTTGWIETHTTFVLESPQRLRNTELPPVYVCPCRIQRFEKEKFEGEQEEDEEE